VPLQFPMGPGVLRAIRRAEELARGSGASRLETRHLFLGLLLEGGADVRSVVRSMGVAFSPVDPLVASMAPIEAAETCVPRPTINYRRCLEDARIVAGDSGVSFVEEKHLLYAILLSQSESVDSILADLETDRRRAREAFEKSCAWAGAVVETYYELGGGPQPR
jgi:ATP-dependent Clp protease ATP-binding subunit ClpA